MGNIMTRAAVNEIMSDENLTPGQRTEQVMALYGRALDDGYISKNAAQTAQETAINKAREDWEKGQEKPDIKASEEYTALQNEFNAYREMQNARGSEAYKDVKPKFFETVYGMIKREDGAKPVDEQLTAIREKYEEYFAPAAQPPKPTFGAPVEGSMPKGEEGATTEIAKAWGFGK